jgi:glutamine cyclotransferase
MRLVFLIILLSLSIACSQNGDKDKYNTLNKKSEITEQINPFKEYSYFEIIDTLEHDVNSYTQGLFYYKGFLYESTGQYGESTLKKLDPNTGEVLKKIDLEDKYFAEGMTIVNDKIYLLTWMETVCFVFDVNTFEKIEEYRYPGQGWGLTHKNNELIMSNGSNNLLVYDLSFNHQFTIPVYNKNNVQYNINEMEFVDGHILANIYGQDEIAIINYQTGDIINNINASYLRNGESNNPNAEVLNGIAYDKEDKVYYLTGKNWQNMYKVKIK